VKNMSMKALVLCAAAGLSIAACAGKPAETIDFANSCKIENDAKYVAITGYLNDGGSIFCSNIGGGPVTCGLMLAETADGVKGRGLKSDIDQGSGSNQIEKFEGSYKKENLRIRDNAGQMVNIGDKVKLTGKFSVTPDASLCFMHADKIEKQ
ncbi:MAG TPA: hypothetical protein VK468_05775, partial [Pyrinomonadaceae bacterium]|nr:hypothetical protein [Pyrinomonadaceae bacterium]